MNKAKLLGITLICVFAVIYNACDNPVSKLTAAGTNRSITQNLGEYSEQLVAYSAGIEKTSLELFGNVTIGSQEFLFNLDESPDFIYVDYTNYGYAVFAAESLELLEFAAQGSLPYQNTRGRRYYNGPKGYFAKINEQFINEVTNESFAISASDAKAYSQTIRQTFSISERELEPEKNNGEFTRAPALPGKNVPEEGTGFISGTSADPEIYINNSHYFATSNPMHGWNEHGTCGSVAAQLLLSYNNYYNDRRIIAPEHLYGGWNNATGNNNINDPANYTNPAQNPNACVNPMLMTSQTTGSNNVYYDALITAIEPGAFSCCVPSPVIDPNTGKVKHSHTGSIPTQVTNGMKNILNGRNVSYTTNSYTVNSANIKAKINAHRPVIILMQKSLGGSNHYVVAYGYGDYKYPVGHPNAGKKYPGYIVHYGWSSDRNNVWINEAWCHTYITMQINHSHSYVSTGTFLYGQEMILRCTTCNHRKAEVFYAGGSGTLLDPYLISTPEHLANIAYENDKCFKLTNNIGLISMWTPIPKFHGVLDGNNKTISNLYLESGGGLLEENNGTIHNLIVKGHFENLHDGSSAGLISNVNHGLIKNCKTENTTNNILHLIIGTAGGITAYNYGAIENCINNASISAFWNYNRAQSMENDDTVVVSVGGISGKNYGSIAGCTNNGELYTGGMAPFFMNDGEEYLGGIAGVHAAGNITDNVNNGSILDNYGVTQNFYSHIIGSLLSGAESGNYCTCLECY